MFSSKSFIVSGLIFRFLIHFEFIFVYGVRKYSNFIILHVVVQFFQHHLLKRLYFSHCIFFPPLSIVSFVIIFSHSEGCLFTLFIVSFVVQKLLSLIRSHLLTFVFISITLGDGS